MSPRRRDVHGPRGPRGEGTVFQRCETKRGCPPADEIPAANGKTHRVRPDHICKGLWIGRIEDDNGKLIQVSGRTENLARRRLVEKKKEITEHGSAAKARIVDDWFWYWIDHVWSGRPNTKSNYKSIYRNHIAPSIGTRQLRKVAQQPPIVRDILQKGRLATLSSTREQAYVLLNQLFADGKREGYCTRNPMELITKPKPRKAEREGPTTDQMRQLLSHNARTGDRLASRWVAVPFTLQRPGECLGLTWDRVIWDHDVLDVTWQLQDLPYMHGCKVERGEIVAIREGEMPPCGKKRAGSCPQRQFEVPQDYDYQQVYGALCLVKPKSRRGERIIPMLPTMRLALEQRHELYEEERPDFVKDYGHVWCRPDGKPLTLRADEQGWKALSKAAGIPAFDLYGGRHTGATLLLEAGVPDPVVQYLMGHAKAQTSHGYQHPDVIMARRFMMEAIEGPLAITG